MINPGEEVLVDYSPAYWGKGDYNRLGKRSVNVKEGAPTPDGGLRSTMARSRIDGDLRGIDDREAWLERFYMLS